MVTSETSLVYEDSWTDYANTDAEPVYTDDQLYYAIFTQWMGASSEFHIHGGVGWRYVFI